ncbi:MAG TPA: hypothetical protein DEP65_06950 [Ruminococcus sp.]|nr:hypothetical protein [Ruminococcus sp.]
MKYHILEDSAENIALNIALDIVNKRYPVGQTFPTQRQLEEEYEMSRTVIIKALNLLINAKVLNKSGRSRYCVVAKNSAAVQFVLSRIAKCYLQIEDIMRALQFGGRETAEIWRTKGAAYEIPRILQEKEAQGRIYAGIKQEQEETLLDEKELDDVDLILAQIRKNTSKSKGIALEDLQDKFYDMLNS